MASYDTYLMKNSRTASRKLKKSDTRARKIIEKLWYTSMNLCKYDKYIIYKLN
jgi:hypothetical protein